MSHHGVETGLYESLVTRALDQRLAASPLAKDIREVDPADHPDILARHLADALRRRLPRNPDERIAVVNQLLGILEDPEEEPLAPIRQLLRVSPDAGPGVRTVTERRPSTPLTDVALLTNAPGEPGLGHELRAELASADGVDLLCAFVQWHGLRFLEAELADARDRGVPIRVVTTTYIGGTERRALDRLVEDFGAEVRVQYDARVTRLHAKAWLFHRNSGFNTAYVGSSNLSRAALVDGAEWNVRLSSATTGHLLDKFSATFDSYWNGEQFEPYRGAADADRLDRCLAEAKGIRNVNRATLISGLEVRPYPFQAAILEALRSEREQHGRHRNLIVAATGTGKTVMAALDYKSLRTGPTRPTLLFVAHRREILEQSRRTYREILGDGGFGELFVDGQRPEHWTHVFASVQSLSSYGVQNIPADAFEVVVVDEFHHAEARTYQALLDRLTPKELLGLTATPERGDGVDVRGFFGGHVAAELRLWDAVQAGLLAPFHYFGVSDGVDLRQVNWRQGRYDVSQLENIYTGSDARARIVLNQLRDKVVDPASMKAIGFCVSVKHAEFMADAFRRAGLPAVSLSGYSSSDERDAAISQLRSGELCTIFTVDIFNEGVDIPEVDTVLLLRPTESPTIFLQQLGRGLRTSPGKDVLTVLDFVAQHRKEYRLDLRYRALTGHRGSELQRQVEKGFPLLPSGCQIVLDRVAQDTVLENLRNNLQMRWPQLAGELRAEPTNSLRDFLDANQLELNQVVRPSPNRSWTHLRADAGLIEPLSPADSQLLRRVRAVTHVDDPHRAHDYAAALRGQRARDPRLAQMLFWTIWPDGGGFASVQEGLASLHNHPLVANEMSQVMDLSFEASRRIALDMPGALAGLPLRPHASYTREEILAGLGHAKTGRPPSHFREGVLFTEVDGHPADAFFITLKKSEADYSPSTLYRDYPINRTEFHWESQSTTSVNSQTGRRYLTGASTPLLFVRQQRRGDFGTSPYVFLGDAEYVRHTGDRPIAITWRLRHPMPADLFAATSLTH
ncbi:DUF3427 domain-containing protein [Luteococcus japonicus]|uniref:DNA/RNA helicase of DEAD/DEAH box family n=1 Tax=Luteococcus japonicus LSP_Lj1 TaxID=1255658 RepID=A0A1R4IC22_9ACTN|nr:DEAD/DEAH box helicase [Luteococcus japonicus]SJN17340.1 DNA/RNA helicase of DEAD/DEAH box family [Luteococcus japonicus LSP_Lj1]